MTRRTIKARRIPKAVAMVAAALGKGTKDVGSEGRTYWIESAPTDAAQAVAKVASLSYVLEGAAYNSNGEIEDRGVFVIGGKILTAMFTESSFSSSTLVVMTMVEPAPQVIAEGVKHAFNVQKLGFQRELAEKAIETVKHFSAEVIAQAIGNVLDDNTKGVIVKRLAPVVVP